MKPTWTLERLGTLVATRIGSVAPGGPAVVAFSGGSDSTALLAALVRPTAPRLPFVVAHVDHGLDAESRHRARRAEDIARALGVGRDRWRLVTLEPEPEARRRHGVEGAARHQRYRALEELCRHEGAATILTAHHVDDQLETLVLRLRQGTGLAGLAGLRPRRDLLLRPFLPTSPSDPAPTADDLRRILAAEGLPWIEDPSNRDTRLARNHVRHEVLPRLFGDDLATVASRSHRVALAAGAARAALDRRLGDAVDLRGDDAGASLALAPWLELATPLQAWALGALHRRAGLAYGPRSAAVAELHRQIARRLQLPGPAGRSVGGRPTDVACSCGDGWEWRADRGLRTGRLRLRPL